MLRWANRFQVILGQTHLAVTKSVPLEALMLKYPEIIIVEFTSGVKDMDFLNYFLIAKTKQKQW